MENRPSLAPSTASGQTTGSTGSAIRKFLTVSFIKDEDGDDCSFSSLDNKRNWKMGEQIMDRLCSMRTNGRDHTVDISYLPPLEHAQAPASATLIVDALPNGKVRQGKCPEFERQDGGGDPNISVRPSSPITPPDRIQSAKSVLFASLENKSHVQPEQNADFLAALEVLQSEYKCSEVDAREQTELLDGNWVMLSPLNFPECLGRNETGDPMYTLGRMSFDMFRPTGLKCSIQSASNVVSSVGSANRRYCRIPTAIPKLLETEVLELLQRGRMKCLRTYNISIALTVEDILRAGGGSFSPVAVRGRMTNIGYTLPDPFVANRFSVWFTGGILEEEQHGDQIRCPSKAWRRIFKDPRRRELSGKARVLAARLLMGAQVPNCMDEKDGSLEFNFTRPIGGHGKAFFDVLYLDDSLRIMRGNKGSIYVMRRR